MSMDKGLTQLEISGYSDDIVSVNVIKGNSSLGDEWGTFKPAFVCLVSTSESGPRSVDVFRVEYTPNGVWLVSHVVVSGGLSVTITKCDPTEEDPDPYTDVAHVQGKIVQVHFLHTFPVDAAYLRRQLVALETEEWQDAVEGLDTRSLNEVAHLILGFPKEILCD